MAVEDKNYTKILSALDNMNYISLQTIDNSNNNCITKPNSCNDNNTNLNIKNQLQNLNTTLKNELSSIPLNSLQSRVTNYQKEQIDGLLNIYYYLFIFYYILVLIYFIGVSYIALFVKKNGLRGYRPYLVPIIAFIGYPYYIAFIERMIFEVFRFMYSMLTSSIYMP